MRTNSSIKARTATKPYKLADSGGLYLLVTDDSTLSVIKSFGHPPHTDWGPK